MGSKDNAIMFADDVNDYKQQYNTRRKQQMIRFIGATAFTLVSLRLGMRSIKKKTYVPTMFQLNYRPPSVSYQSKAKNAFLYSTQIVVGTFGMLIFGSCWVWDISSLAEFREYKGISNNLENETVERPTHLPLNRPGLVAVSEKLMNQSN